MAEALEVSPQEANLRLSGDTKALIIDVREPDEWAQAHIDGAVLIPMQSVPSELPKIEALADEQDLMVICHHGVRSLQVASWLRAHGIDNAFSVAGGIDRWSREINADVPRY